MDRANIDDQLFVCITMEHLPNNEARTFLISWKVVLCSAEYFQYINPRFLLRFTSGFVSLQYARHFFVGCMHKNTSQSTFLYLLQSSIPLAQATKMVFMLKLHSF